LHDATIVFNYVFAENALLLYSKIGLQVTIIVAEKHSINEANWIRFTSDNARTSGPAVITTY